MQGRYSELFEERKKGVLGEEVEERKIIVGDTKNPIWIGYADELKKFFTSSFFWVVDIWRKFKAGVQKIDESCDPDLIEAIVILQEHYEVYFSQYTMIREYLGAIIKRLDVRR